MLLQHPHVQQARRLQYRTVPVAPVLFDMVVGDHGSNQPYMTAGWYLKSQIIPAVRVVVERKTGTGSTTPYWRTFPVVPQARQATDEAVGNSTFYSCRAVAVNASGVSNFSNSKTAILGAGNRPSRPEDFTVYWNGTAMAITAYDSATTENGLELERSDDGGAYNLIYTWAAHSSIGYLTPHLDATALANHSYQYRIRAYRTTGPTYSDWVYSGVVQAFPGLVSFAVPLSVYTTLVNTFQADTHLPATGNFGVYAMVGGMVGIDPFLVAAFGNSPGMENGAEVAFTVDGVTFTLSPMALPEQGVHDLQAVGEDIWVCGTDPTADWSLGNVYHYTDAGGWVQLRTLPLTIHALGLWHDGVNLWVAAGCHTGDNVTWKGRILKSADGGQTWTAVDVNAYRLYDVLGFDGQLYAVGYDYAAGVGYSRHLHVSADGTNWSLVGGVTPAIEPRLNLFNGELVGVQASLAGIYSIAAGGAVTLHATAFTIADGWNVLTSDGTHLYALADDGTIWRSTVDLDTWEAYTYVPGAISIYWWSGFGLLIGDRGLSARLWVA